MGRRDDKRVAVVLFNRDLRVRDHPALAAAAETHRVAPLFVLDPAVLRCGAPNRIRFLLESMLDLRRSLQSRGADLIVRQGDTVVETMALARETAAESVFTSADVSGLAQRRQRALAAACAGEGREFRLFPGVTVVAPGELRPSSGGTHFRVFTPYWRRWEANAWRSLRPPPEHVELAEGIDPGRIPSVSEIGPGSCSPDVVTGGEDQAQSRLARWLETSGDDVWETSRLSAYLRFGCVSPLDAATQAMTRDPERLAGFVRALCWRDFFHQVTAAFPAINKVDYRPRFARRWRTDPGAFEAWVDGNTGVPLVDAGMRQLRQQGWMPNRARLVAASYLTKSMGIDWRLGAAHFSAWLIDGDVPCNYGNWQWAAGTGNDRRPNRVLNPIAQARRYDRDGAYVSAWVDS